MTDDELVDAFGNACLSAGRSNGGLCISTSAESDWQAMKQWQQKLKDRLRELAKKEVRP